MGTKKTFYLCSVEQLKPSTNGKTHKERRRDYEPVLGQWSDVRERHIGHRARTKTALQHHFDDGEGVGGKRVREPQGIRQHLPIFCHRAAQRLRPKDAQKHHQGVLRQLLQKRSFRTRGRRRTLVRRNQGTAATS